MIVAGKTLDAYAIGYARQMLGDNQYLNNLIANTSYYASPTFNALYAMEVYDDYYAVKATARQRHPPAHDRWPARLRLVG